MNEFVGFVLECFHDVWLIACMLWVASCLVPAYQGWLLDGCWLLVARFKVDVLRQGRPPLRPELPTCESTGCVCVCVAWWLCAVVCSCLALLLLVVFVLAAVVAVVCVLLQCLWEVYFDIVDSAL